MPAELSNNTQIKFSPDEVAILSKMPAPPAEISYQLWSENCAMAWDITVKTKGLWAGFLIVSEPVSGEALEVFRLVVAAMALTPSCCPRPTSWRG